MMNLAQLVDEFALAMRSENYAPRSVETTLGVRRRALASWTNGGRIRQVSDNPAFASVSPIRKPARICP